MVAELLNRISVTTRRDLLQDGALPGERLQLGEFRKASSPDIWSNQRRLVVNLLRYHLQGHRQKFAPSSDARGDTGGQRSAFPQET